VSQERIVFLDPRGNLSYLKEPLARHGILVESLASAEKLFAEAAPSGGPGKPSPASLVVVFDGDPESGVEPQVFARLAEMSPEIPPVAVAVVGDRPRGRG